MTAEKINQLMVKTRFSGGEILFGEWDEEHYGFSADGITCHILRKDQCYIDTEKLLDGKPVFLWQGFKKPVNTHWLHTTGVSRAVRNREGKPTTIVEFTNAEENTGDSIWVDERALKQFPRVTRPQGTDDRSPIYIYEQPSHTDDEVLTGFALPFRKNKD